MSNIAHAHTDPKFKAKDLALKISWLMANAEALALGEKPMQFWAKFGSDIHPPESRRHIDGRAAFCARPGSLPPGDLIQFLQRIQLKRKRLTRYFLRHNSHWLNRHLMISVSDFSRLSDQVPSITG